MLFVEAHHASGDMHPQLVSIELNLIDLRGFAFSAMKNACFIRVSS